MPHKIRASYVYQRAHELAEGSIHHCPAEIIAALQAEGYPEAADLLNSENIRADLIRTCRDRRPATLHLDLRH